MKYITALFAAISALLTIILTMGYLELYWGIIDSDIPIVLEGTMEYEQKFWELIGQNIGTPLLIIFFFVLFVFFLSLAHKYNKHKKDTINYQGILEEPYIIYLRSFIADKQTRKKVSPIDIRSEEEMVVDVLNDIAPVYAIGDPQDKKMPLGASRIYVPDAEWKKVALELVKKAELVVLRLGETNNFWWEVEMVLENKPIDKLLFIVPQSKNFNNVACLYKILLDHNIDISALTISIEKPQVGSISNFIFFDSDGVPRNTNVSIPRFTNFFVSYGNILRNSLSDFFKRYGMDTAYKHTFRFTRFLGLLYIVSILFCVGAQTFSDFTKLKYQRPYEIVEECRKDSIFSEKYSDAINGANLYRCIAEASKGIYMLSNEDIVGLVLIERDVFSSISDDEYNHINDAPYNSLLMIKKYAPDKYSDYVNILSKAAILSVNYPEDCINLIRLYKAEITKLPQWFYDFSAATENYDTNLEYMRLYYDTLKQHINDYNIGEVIKILSSQKVE